MTEVFYHNSYNRDRLVHIVDADLPTSEALSVLFRLEGFQTECSSTMAQLLSALEHRHPDVLVMNMVVGGEDSLPMLRRFKSMRTGAPVFLISEESDVTRAVEAMKAGCADVITTPIDTERLVRAVRDSLRRDVHVGAVQGGWRPVEIRGFNQLTPREREVLQLITNGQSNKEAGRELGISPRTIEVHRARVMEKLGARNTADLIRIVLTS
ncbi:MAG: response regulator transcription factor [Alphaproteobacteria bacterium]|nr:response regulator transcription factor [Alphaproteobacteria bacterium]